MIDRKAYYRRVMNDFTKRYGLTEEEFLRLYNSSNRKEEELKLPEPLRADIIHLYVAYGLYLKQQNGDL